MTQKKRFFIIVNRAYIPVYYPGSGDAFASVIVGNLKDCQLLLIEHHPIRFHGHSFKLWLQQPKPGGGSAEKGVMQT